jgi:DHA1 family inner membrane transport protein
MLAALTLNRMPAAIGASPIRELGAFCRVQVWLTLGIAAIGFGGLFAVYSYITPMLMFVTGTRESTVPIILAIIGAGMVCGTFVGGWLADRGVMRAVGILLIFDLGMLALIPLTAHNLIAVSINLFLIGLTALAIGPALQTRLMDVAADAQTLAAALNHSAFNLANALGAWAGGIAIDAGLGWTSTGVIGAGLAAGGFVIYLIALRAARQDKTSAA